MSAMGVEEIRNIICRNEDELYMREALFEAAEAAAEGEVPVGAVIVLDGRVIARAHNKVEARKRSSAHAEMLALEAAEKACGAKWLPDAVMYVTLEPCSMCAGALVLARIGRLVIGTNDPKTGACGSLLNVAANASLNHRIDVMSGVLGNECAHQLREFFRGRRAGSAR